MISRQALPIDYNLSYDLKSYYEFIKSYENWIYSTNQPVGGLPGKPFIVSGITDAFNQLYSLYKTIGIFDGEYGYHKLVLNDRVTTDLEKADCIVISHPFSANGMGAHEKINIADSYQKPIFIDCAFFGVCHNINFDFSKYKNIHSVCFSLSKTFGTGFNRVGLLYTKDKFPVTIYNKWNYPLISNTKQHKMLIEQRSPDWAFNTFKQKQLEICKELNITPSNTILFGYTSSPKYNNFKRGYTNRICISSLLNEKVKRVKNDLDRMGQS